MASLLGGGLGILVPSLAASLRAGALRTASRDGSRPITILLGLAWGWGCSQAFPPDLVGGGVTVLATLAGLPMMAIALVDIRDRVIHDGASLGLGLCLIAWRWVLDGTPWAALTGGVLAFLGAEVLRRLYRRLRAREGLGAGDVGLIGMAGLALSPTTMALFLIAAGGLGLLWGGMSSLLSKRGGLAEEGFPFAPALMGGVALAILGTGFGGGFPSVLYLSSP